MLSQRTYAMRCCLCLRVCFQVTWHLAIVYRVTSPSYGFTRPEILELSRYSKTIRSLGTEKRRPKANCSFPYLPDKPFYTVMIHPVIQTDSRTDIRPTVAIPISTPCTSPGKNDTQKVASGQFLNTVTFPAIGRTSTWIKADASSLN